MSEAYNFVGYYGGERGANITIVGSEFKNSVFCRGSIVYRKAPYIENSIFGFVNYTY